MALSRIFVSDDLSAGRELHLGGDRARYIGRALRLRVGDSISVFNGNDGEFSASVVMLGRDAVVVQVDSSIATATESKLKLHLVQGISRGERMDFVIQKATELGVKRISPVLTEYGVVKLDAERAAKRRDHWQGVAESACEQSGRTRPPLIDTPMDLNAWLGARSKEADTDVILHPEAAQSLASKAEPSTKLCLLIGPEGGFSAREFDDAEIAGFAAVSLGPRILRTETAALAALAAAQTLWGDLS